MDGKSGLSTPPATSESGCETKRREKKPGPGSSVTPKMIEQLVIRQQYRCALSGLELTPLVATVDHIVPLTRGGEHDLTNAQIVVDYINTSKGQMTNDEFIAMCVAVAKRHGHYGSTSDDDTQLDH